MKRKYEEFQPATKRRAPHGFFTDPRPTKIARKNPIIRFIAAIRGYLARKLYRFKVYHFYS